MTVYRSGNVDQAIADAQQAIAQHRADMTTACCSACGMTAPCPRVCAATGLLTAMGQPALPTPANSGLLTYGWRLVFGATGAHGLLSAAMNVGHR